MGEMTPPAPLTDIHQLEKFDCGVASLNDWLKKRARKNEAIGASRTYVICNQNDVIGYYTLATGSVAHEQAASKIKRNMPDPVPVMVLGRLGIYKNWHNGGLGKGLLKDAVLRTYAVSKQVGVKALLVHALSKEVTYFYKTHGFMPSPLDEMTLLLAMKDVEQYL